jgi:hypothetical protein
MSMEMKVRNVIHKKIMMKIPSYHSVPTADSPFVYTATIDTYHLLDT